MYSFRFFRITRPHFDGWSFSSRQSTVSMSKDFWYWLPEESRAMNSSGRSGSSFENSRIANFPSSLSDALIRPISVPSLNKKLQSHIDNQEHENYSESGKSNDFSVFFFQTENVIDEFAKEWKDFRFPLWINRRRLRPVFVWVTAHRSWKEIFLTTWDRESLLNHEKRRLLIFSFHDLN